MGKMLDKLNEYLENATQEELQETYNKLSHLLCKDNSTIVERAVNVQHEVTPNQDWGDVRYGYERGATDQKNIDEEELGKALLYAVHKTTERTKREMIERSCELLCKTCNIGVCGEDQKCHRYKGFRKALEE